MSIRHPIAGMLCATALAALAACSNGADGKATDTTTPSGPAVSAQTTPPTHNADPAPSGTSPSTDLGAGETCPKLVAVDPSVYLGPGATVSEECVVGSTVDNELGAISWTERASTMRVSVQVLGPKTGQRDGLTFAEHLKDPTITKQQRDCSVDVNGTGHDCIDLMSATGTIVVKLNGLTVYVFASQNPSDPTDSSAVKLRPTDQNALRDFATDVCKALSS